MDSKRAWPPREDAACLPRDDAKDARSSRPTKRRMRRYASLRGRREFALVLRRGRASSTKHLVVFALRPHSKNIKTAAPQTRVGIVITKKVGTAVERNRLRRRCKAILDQSRVAESAMWYVVQFRPAAAQLPYPHLQDQIESALAASTRMAGNANVRREATRA
jgi:ribonuclease P protein component